VGSTGEKQDSGSVMGLCASPRDRVLFEVDRTDMNDGSAELENVGCVGDCMFAPSRIGRDA